jgi:hypothetical protein
MSFQFAIGLPSQGFRTVLGAIVFSAAVLMTPPSLLVIGLTFAIALKLLKNTFIA